MKKNKLKILLFDLETMPNLVRTWRKWEQNVIWYERYGYTWSISWKWLGEKKIHHKNITDFPLYKKDKFSDKELVKFIHNLVDEADICIAQNGNAFDLKYITGRFAHYRMKPPQPYQKIDTKLLFKKYLNEDSNSLKDICIKHNLPHKLETGGEKLWELCEIGNKKAIRKMREYNNGDVVSLEAAYLFILPYIDNHPNIGLMNGEKFACPNCGSLKLQRRGFAYSRVGKFQRVQCQDCASWHQQPIGKNKQVR
jgi:predicted RNA-binding Zn-ribbon protein involved in translation (DUF1610 family)